MPYDHKNTTPEGLPSQRMRLILEKLNRFQLNKRCLVGSGGGSVGFVSLTHAMLFFCFKFRRTGFVFTA